MSIFNSRLCTLSSHPSTMPLYSDLLGPSFGEELMIQPRQIHQVKKLRHLITRINLLPIRAEIHHQPLLFTILRPLVGDLGSICQRNGIPFTSCVGLVRCIDDKGENVLHISNVFFGADRTVTWDEYLDFHGEEFIADRNPIGEWTCPDNREACRQLVPMSNGRTTFEEEQVPGIKDFGVRNVSHHVAIGVRRPHVQ